MEIYDGMKDDGLEEMKLEVGEVNKSNLRTSMTVTYSGIHLFLDLV